MEGLQSVKQAQGTGIYPSTNPVKSSAPAAPEQKKDGDKKLIGALVGLGVIAAAGVATAIAIKKGKVNKLSDIKFDKGIATIGEDGKKFSGKIVDKLKSGDEITLIYKDGIIQESARKGKKNFSKVFENINGEKIVKETIDGKTQEKNITRLTKEAKEKLTKTQGQKSNKSAGKLTEAIQGQNSNKSAEKLTEAQQKAAKAKIISSMSDEQLVSRVETTEKAIKKSESELQKLQKTIKEETSRYEALKKGQETVRERKKIIEASGGTMNGTKKMLKNKISEASDAIETAKQKYETLLNKQNAQKGLLERMQGEIKKRGIK